MIKISDNNIGGIKMDSFGLGNILNALGLTKKLDTVQKSDKKGSASNNSQISGDSQDSVSISDESFIKAASQTVSQEIKAQNQAVDEAKIAQIKEKISKNEYDIPAEKIADQMIKGATDIFNNLP